MTRELSRAGAKAYYDRFGARQDGQSFYEDPALDDLVAHADFESAAHVFELGCGTGRFAQRLLDRRLPPAAQYVGVDLSTTMVDLARRRLAAYGDRVCILQADGVPRFPLDAAWADRVVSTYVLDLLSDADVGVALAESARVLAPGGRLCVVSLTFGVTPVSRLVTAGWRLAFRLSPRLVGGCRPLRLVGPVERAGFRVAHHAVLAAFGVPSEIVVAERALV